jgi:ABC-type antimicrobial peptide transport system permease subunit
MVVKFTNYYDSIGTLNMVRRILNMIFNVIIIITMTLCLFSLCSSMSANLMDQTKEIGIMRAMGFTRRRVKCLYFYEAFILVMASSLLGVMIGCIVGYTMTL